MTRTKTFQAKLISDEDMVRTVARLMTEPYNFHSIPHWVHTWPVYEAFDEIPEKVVHAKLSACLRKGYLTGCDCGCRGDFEVTPKGRELIA